MMLARIKIVCYIIVLPILASHFAEYIVLSVSMVFFLPCACYAGILQLKNPFSITRIDVIVLLFVLFCCLSVAWIRHYQIDGLIYHEWIFLLIVYWMARTFDRNGLSWLLLALTLSGGVQAVIGLLQYTGFLSAPHSYFRACGSFHNPGPWGGFLAISFVATSCLLILKKTRIWRMMCGLMCLLIGSALVLSNSRAAWTAVLVATVYMLYQAYPAVVLCIAKKKLVSTFLFILTVSVAIGLYQYKKPSADVRLLIATVGVNLFADSPLYGHGVASFPMKYMECQADYFERHHDSAYISLSDNNTQAFNELLTVACELGSIGLILVILIMALALFSRSGVFEVRCLLVSLCVFSCFSYPGDVFSLKILFPLFVGLSLSSSLCEMRVYKKIYLSLGVLFFLLALLDNFCVVRCYDEAFQSLKEDNCQVAMLPYNRKYMSRYVETLFDKKKYEDFVSSTTAASFPFMTSTIKCDIGMAYMKLGRMREAERELMCAYWMVPSKVLPKYYLFMLYRDTHYYEKAKLLADELVTMKVSQVGSVYLEARSAARAFLNGGN